MNFPGLHTHTARILVLMIGLVLLWKTVDPLSAGSLNCLKEAAEEQYPEKKASETAKEDLFTESDDISQLSDILEILESSAYQNGSIPLEYIPPIPTPPPNRG